MSVPISGPLRCRMVAAGWVEKVTARKSAHTKDTAKWSVRAAYPVPDSFSWAGASCTDGPSGPNGGHQSKRAGGRSSSTVSRPPPQLHRPPLWALRMRHASSGRVVFGRVKPGSQTGRSATYPIQARTTHATSWIPVWGTDVIPTERPLFADSRQASRPPVAAPIKKKQREKATSRRARLGCRRTSGPPWWWPGSPREPPAKDWGSTSAT
jgi:hypothetical protein